MVFLRLFGPLGNDFTIFWETSFMWTHDLNPYLHLLTYTNSSYSENPLPPDFWGGNYIQYLRFYLPENAQFIDINASPSLPTTLKRYPKPFSNDRTLLTSTNNFGFQELGFFHITQAGNISQVNLSYSLPQGDQQNYRLNILKQNGLTQSPQVVYFMGKQFQTDLNDNYQLDQPLP